MSAPVFPAAARLRARSPRGAAGAVVLLAAVPLALASSIAFGRGAELIIHVALGLSFALIAFAVFDFRLPRALQFAAFAAIVTLAALFSLQAVSEVTPALRHVAYDVLGQRLEKSLGYVFLLWCACVLVFDSKGVVRIVGALVFVAVAGAEIYAFTLSRSGVAPPQALKLLYLPLFVWLLLESLKPRD